MGAYRHEYDGAALILMSGQERSLLVKINTNKGLRAVTFSANGEYLLSSGLDQNVGVWRVQDGQRVATINAEDVLCLAVSKNGKWIAGGTLWGEVFVLDAETYETVWKHRDRENYRNIAAVDFSSDSRKLVSASWNRTATIWDVASGETVRTLCHKQGLIVARYSLDGDRIATAIYNGSVQVWDSNGGHLLVDIPVTSLCNNGILWFNDYLYVVCGSAMKELDPSTGSIITEWPIPGDKICSPIAIPVRGTFIAYSTGQTLTLWDMVSHTQLGLIEHHGDINPITLSPGNRFYAIGREDGTIITKGISHIMVST